MAFDVICGVKNENSLFGIMLRVGSHNSISFFSHCARFFYVRELDC